MYPPVDPDELTRHATEVGRVLLAAGLAPAGEPHCWPPLACFDFTRISARIKRRCYQHFRFAGLLFQDMAHEGLLFDHLLHTAWLLAYGYVYQDLDGLYWVDPRQPYERSSLETEHILLRVKPNSPGLQLKAGAVCL